MPKHGGGPRTPAGRKAVSMNALRHGLLSKSPVVLGESTEEYEAHLEGLKDSYVPVGYREELCVRRIAFCEWKLMQIDQLEVSLVEIQIEELESPELATSIVPEDLTEDELEWTKTSPSTGIAILNSLLEEAPEVVVPAAAIAAIVAALKRTVRRSSFQKKEIGELMRASMDVRNGWTVGSLRKVLELVSSQPKGSVEENRRPMHRSVADPFHVGAGAATSRRGATHSEAPDGDSPSRQAPPSHHAITEVTGGHS
jgi:hypothetical protein